MIRALIWERGHVGLARRAWAVAAPFMDRFGHKARRARLCPDCVEDERRLGKAEVPLWRRLVPRGKARLPVHLRRCGRDLKRQLGRFGAADQESGRRRCASRMNASQSRALAIHPPVRTALTPTVGSRFREGSVEAAPGESWRAAVSCSTTSAQGRGSSEPSLSPVARAWTASSRSRSAPSLSHRWTAAQFLGASPSGFGRASFGVTHPGRVMMLWL